MKQTIRERRGARAKVGKGKPGAVATRGTPPRLTVDQAFIALLIGAMGANEHVSPEEAARAHHIIWSMKRFRHKSGETVGRLIDEMRTFVETHGAMKAMAIATSTIPVRLRATAFALSSDLVLADGKIDRAERRFLHRLAEELGLESGMRDVILDVILVKNSA
jgi:uncharacterized tellurite resistance protein B-like protein